MFSAKFGRDTWLIFRRTLRQGRRNPALAFVFPMVPPLVGVSLFSQLFEDIVNLGQLGTDNYVSWVAAGFILMTAMAGAGFTATGLVVDANSGYLDRLRLLPVHPTAIMLGRQLFEVTRVVPAAIAVFGVSVALGANVSDGGLGLLGIIGLVALWALAWNGLFYVLALRTMNTQASLSLQPMFFPVLALSTTFVPTAVMPGSIETIATLNPCTYLVDSVRMFMIGGFNWSDFGVALGSALAILAVTQYFAVRSFGALVHGD